MTTTDIIKAAKDYRELQTMIRELEAEAEAIKANLTAHMDAEDMETIKADCFTIRWTSYNSTRLDTTAIKREMPELAARYTVTNTARRFQVA